MLLDDLAEALEEKRILGDNKIEIKRVEYDSRQCLPGSLFVAIRGGSFDGHKFAADAVARGAVAVAAEDTNLSLPHPVPIVLVPESRKALAALSAKLYNYPTRRLQIAGVTGTKGKTTTTYLIQSILNTAEKISGVVGTLGTRIDGEEIPTEHTTPESSDLQRIFAEMVERGVSAASIEVSSHGLYQHRTDYCEFDCGVFTNLTRDHLDFHETMDAYLDAKLIMFRDYPKLSNKRFTAVVNVDDPAAESVIKATAGDVITFGVEKDADLVARDIEVSPTGVKYTLIAGGRKEGVTLAIGGYFNVYNSLAAAGAAHVLGVNLETAARGLAAAPGVPGRFERVDCGQDFAVIVDYAHTPDSMRSILETARSLTRARVITVFGCGGNRDRGKRPMMGKIAADLADFVVVTSDNPRKEEPQAIIDEIVSGVDRDQIHKLSVEVDRFEGIRAALQSARTDDIVVIAGKGHEDYQIFADHTIHFDDREAARKILEERHQVGSSDNI